MNKLSNVLLSSSRIFHHRESTPNVLPFEMSSISSNNDHKIGLFKALSLTFIGSCTPSKDPLLEIFFCGVPQLIGSWDVCFNAAGYIGHKYSREIFLVYYLEGTLVMCCQE
jgi:hypothetical protein